MKGRLLEYSPVIVLIVLGSVVAYLIVEGEKAGWPGQCPREEREWLVDCGKMRPITECREDFYTLRPVCRRVNSR